MNRLPKAALFKRLSILLIAGHSLIAGFALLFAPGDVLAFMRWPPVSDLFFVSQAGIFLVILGFAYLAALRHDVLVWLIVGSKLGAVMFLFGQGFLGRAPLQVMLAGAGDAGLGLLALAAALVQSPPRSDGVVSHDTSVGEEYVPTSK